MTTHPHPPTIENELFLLQHGVDRQALRVLCRGEDAPMAFETLARRIHDGQAVHAERRHVHIRLHHVLLPRLEAANLIAWDREEDQVTFTGDGRIDGMLDSMDEMA